MSSGIPIQTLAFDNGSGVVEVSSANPLPVTGGGGGGGGSSLSDTVWVDNAGVYFVYRDTGSGTPTAYRVDTWASFSPSAPISPSKRLTAATDVVSVEAGITPIPTRATSSAATLAAGIFSTVTPNGDLNVSIPATTVINDSFDGVVIDTTQWTTQTSTGTVSQSNGSLSLDSSITASAYAAIYSKAQIAPQNISLQALGFTLKLEATTIKTNMVRFWGMGTVPGTPTTAVPITDGFGFLLGTTGVLTAVVFASGVAVFSQNLTVPTDGLVHKYGVLYRADTMVFMVDDFTLPVAVNTSTAPNQQTLPMTLVAVAGTTPPTSGQVMQVSVATYGDFGKNGNQIVDGTYPWRKAIVTANNALSVCELDTMVTGQATQTASGNNIILSTAGTGSYDVTGYRSAYFQIIPTGTVSSGVVTFEGSNDGTTFVAIPLYDRASLTANPVTTISPTTGVSRFLEGPVGYRYVRARISTVIGGGGSLQLISKFSGAEYTPTQYTIVQATAANLNTTAVIASGTVTTLTTLSNGQTAHSAASTGSPLRIGGRVNTAVDTTLVAGDASDLFISTGGAAITKPYAVPELDWVYAAAASGISNTTTAVTIKAAAAASVRNYITGIDISTDGALGAASEVAIRDGAAGTVLWRMKISTAGLPNGRTIEFPTPLKGTAATLLEVVTLTASITGAVYINAQGYTAI